MIEMNDLQFQIEDHGGLSPTFDDRNERRVALKCLSNFLYQGFIAFIRPLFAAADRIGGVDMSLPLERLDDTARRWQTTGSREAVDDDVRE